MSSDTFFIHIKKLNNLEIFFKRFEMRQGLLLIIATLQLTKKFANCV